MSGCEYSSFGIQGTPAWIERLLSETTQMELEAAQLLVDFPPQGTVGFQLRDDGLVAALQPGSSAEKSLAINDHIRSIDGISIDGMDISDMADLIKGPTGTSVRLDVERQGAGILSVDLNRHTQPMYTPIVPETTQTGESILCGPGFTFDSSTLMIKEVESHTAVLGVRPRDQLVNVDGVSMDTIQKNDITQLLFGKEGTSLEVLLKRVDEHGAQLLFFEIERKWSKPVQRTVLIKELHDAKPLRSSFASGFGNLLSGWIGKVKT
jgi:C-terminal processing protease CtpA/Prc